MKLKKIKIGIKDLKNAFNDFEKTGKAKKPSSINELARIIHRDIKNVADDVKYLGQMGLIEKTETNRKIAPSIDYDKISLEIAV